MHQQIPPLDQCGIPSQMAQNIVICPKLSYGPPIQLVYDAQTHAPIMVQRNEEQVQIQQPMLLNVQNTPPWIQTQTQNVIYVQQTPNQMLPYLQPNMIQNAIFQTPYNFQQIIPQEPIIPIMQIPTLIQNNTVQNQPANLNYPILHEGMTQNPIINVNANGAIEKMPFVAQNQVNAALKAEMMQLNQLNNISGTEKVSNEAQNQVTSRNEMEPTTDQNQESNISDTETFVVKVPNKPKDKNMTVLSYLLSKKPSELEITPITKDRHVQTDFPLANTSKNTNHGQVSINNAEQNNEKTKGIPQLNSLDTRQDLIGSNLYNQRHIRPIRPNITKNSEVPLHIRSNIPDTINVRTIYRPILPKPVVRPYEFKSTNFVNPNFVTLRAPAPAQTMILSNRGVMANYTLINEAYNAPNVNNNKGIEVHNITSMSGGTIINSNESGNTQNFDKMNENSATDKSAETTAANKLNLISVEEIYLKEYEGGKYKQKENKNENDNESELNLKPMIKNNIHEIQPHIKEKVGQDKEKVEQKKKKVDHEKKKTGPGTKKKINLDKNITSVINKDDEKKCIKHIPIFILTHVLDGHVIQESNVAFPIHKPLKEKITYEPYEIDTPDWKKDVEPLLPLKYLHIVDNDNHDGEYIEDAEGAENIEDAELDIEVVEDGNPFSNLMKSTIEEWNVLEVPICVMESDVDEEKEKHIDQLSSHLTEHNWKETATKLREQEIDGESLLLVSEHQLVHIGIKVECFVSLSKVFR